MIKNNRTHCPLCEAPNQCALAVSSEATSCWCQQHTFSAELIAKANNTHQQRCICQQCAEKAQTLAAAIH